MAFDNNEQKQVGKIAGDFIEKHRPPPHIRPQLDLGFQVQDQSVEIQEIRPRWNNKEEIVEHPVARATFIRARQHWKVYWKQADLKWHAYSPSPIVNSLGEFLELVGKDTHHCFFG
ncbi:MAG: DUF3024 domain-containing protein [Balneolales bacterium]